MFTLAAKCLGELNRYYYFTALSEVVDDVELLIKDQMDRADEDLISACLGVVIHIQELDSDAALFPLHLKQIVEYFELPYQEMEWSKKVSELLPYCQNVEKYKQVHLKYLEDELRPRHLAPQQFTRQYEYVLSESFSGAQIKKLKKIILDNLNNVWNLDKSTSGRMLDFKCDGTLSITLEGAGYDHQFLDLCMDEFRIEKKSEQEIPQKTNPYTPAPHYRHFMEQYEVMDLDRLVEEYDEDIDRIQEHLAGKTIDELRLENSLRPESETLIKALDAFYLPIDRSKKACTEILESFPDCVEAYTCLAGWEKDPDQKIALLSSAVDAGERALDLDELDESRGCWGDHTTRPYMRALHLLGIEYITFGKLAEGEDILLDLIDMNPNDNLGVRDFLIEYALENRKWAIIRHLKNLFPDEESIIFSYCHYIYLYQTLGRKGKTKRALLDAFDRNPYPFLFLMGTAEVPENFEQYRIGSPEEGVMALPILDNFFSGNTKAIRWTLQVLHQCNRDLGNDEDDYTFEHVNYN